MFNNPPGVGTVIKLEASGDCKFVGPDPDEITATVVDQGGAPGAFAITGFEIEDRVQSTDPDAPDPEDDGQGSIFVTGTDPGVGGQSTLIATFSCQTIACVPDGSGGFSPAASCPTP